MKRPGQQPKGNRPETLAERRALAGRASYVGSGEHKAERWWGGLPESGARSKKQRTTICDLVTAEDRDRATEWVQAAIVRGQYEFIEGDQDFPRNVWYEADGSGWFGRCINTAAGQYKGWPMNEDERRAHFG